MPPIRIETSYGGLFWRVAEPAGYQNWKCEDRFVDLIKVVAIRDLGRARTPGLKWFRVEVLRVGRRVFGDNGKAFMRRKRGVIMGERALETLFFSW